MSEKNRNNRCNLLGLNPTYVGVKSRAPWIIREVGLEWAYRLFQEPRRLWMCNIQTISPFLYLTIQVLIRSNLNKNLRQTVSTNNLFINLLPKDYYGELVALQTRWRKKQLSEQIIKIRTYFCVFNMLKGYLNCKIENLWLDRNKPN